MDTHNRVLVAFDFSPGSRRALSTAVRISGTLDRRLHVIHVIESRVVDSLAGLLRKPPTEVRRVALAKARLALGELAMEQETPPETRLHVTIREPVPKILEWADRLDPDFLILGESGLEQPSFRWDPQATQVFNASSTRVLLVGEQGELARCRPAARVQADAIVMLRQRVSWTKKAATDASRAKAQESQSPLR